MDSLSISKCRCQVYQSIDLKITEHTVVNPDILIVCKPILKQYLDFPPALVVEILSPSTEMKDRNTKFQLYETFGIRYYVIINSETETIEIFRLNESKKYQLLSDLNIPMDIDENCSIVLSWDKVFIEQVSNQY